MILKAGWYVSVIPLTYGRGRIIVTDGVAVDESWDYLSLIAAVDAYDAWELTGFDGEPCGWNRALTRDDQGEWIAFRRRPDLTPESEYVAP